MGKYRLQLKAWVCITVEASSDGEAIAKAERIKLDLVEGMDLDVSTHEVPYDFDTDGRVYFEEKEPAEVIDVGQEV